MKMRTPTKEEEATRARDRGPHTLCPPDLVLTGGVIRLAIGLRMSYSVPMPPTPRAPTKAARRATISPLDWPDAHAIQFASVEDRKKAQGLYEELNGQLLAWRETARQVAKLIRSYDKNWHVCMWDGGLVDEREERAWAKIMKQSQAKGL
jgi:hypothetical protein